MATIINRGDLNISMLPSNQKNLKPVVMLFLLATMKKFDENRTGNTKIQKLLFLIQKEGETKIENGFNFKSDKYGPAAEEFFDVVYQLSDKNLISFELDESQNIRNCKLTKEGEAKANELEKKFPELKKAVQKIAAQYANLELGLLLLYVYARYSEYTSKSQIKDEVSQIAKGYFSLARKKAQDIGFKESELNLTGV